MKIKTATLRDFFKKSNKIKSSGIIPIYDYLLISCTNDEVSITKTNGEMFVKSSYEESNEVSEAILIEEKRLIGFASKSQSDVITIVAGKRTILNDGTHEVKISPIDGATPKNFPSFPESKDGEKFVISPEVTEAIGEAKGFASVMDSAIHYIRLLKHDGKYCVFATNGYILYHKEFNEELPLFYISPSVAAIICQYQSLIYFAAGNYDFFDTGNTVYGFLKSSYNSAPDFGPTLKRINRENQLSVNKGDILGFCELANSMATKEIPVLHMDDDGNGIRFKYEETETGVETEKKFSAATKNYEFPASAANCAYLIQVLKCFVSKDIFISAHDFSKPFCFTSPEEPGLTLILMPCQRAN